MQITKRSDLPSTHAVSIRAAQEGIGQQRKTITRNKLSKTKSAQGSHVGHQLRKILCQVGVLEVAPQEVVRLKSGLDMLLKSDTNVALRVKTDHLFPSN